MSDPTADDPALLAHDADLATPLSRVAYQEGMLLGLEATRAEQDYHRRRLLRHHAWLHGAGTVVGLLVTVADNASGSAVLTVHAGLGLDGLGRELHLVEPYCLDLRRWFVANVATLDDHIESVAGTRTLYLRLTARHQPSAHNLSPVLAAETNAGTDAVAPGRIADAVQLELLGDARTTDAWVPPLPAANENERLRRIQQTEAQPLWRRLLAARGPATPSPSEVAFLAAFAEEAAASAERLSRLNLIDCVLPAPAPVVDESGPSEAELSPLARVLLATVVIDLGADANAPTISRGYHVHQQLDSTFRRASGAGLTSNVPQPPESFAGASWLIPFPSYRSWTTSPTPSHKCVRPSPILGSSAPTSSTDGYSRRPISVREQVYLDGRLREVGRALGHGVASGLEPRLSGTRLRISPGGAVTPAGRLLVVDAAHAIEVDSGDRAKLRQLNDGLYGHLPGGLYAITLATAESTRGIAEAFPTDLSARRSTRPDVVVEGVELLLVRLDVPIPRGSAVQARAQLAPQLAGVRPRGLAEDQVSVGLLAIDGDRVAWLDAKLCRRPLRLDSAVDTTNSALAEHWEALMTEVASYRVNSGQAPAFAAREYLRLLPAVGALPKAAVDPVRGTQQFFPGHWDVRLAPLRRDDWRALRAEALRQEPLDSTSPAAASVLVLALVEPSLFGAYAQALEVPRAGRAFPRLDPLRLRLAPKALATVNDVLDTDADVWNSLWPQISDSDVVYVRRPALGAETGVSVVVMAQGTSLPPPPTTGTGSSETDAFAAVVATRVTEDVADVAKRVERLARDLPTRADVAQAFLLLDCRFDSLLSGQRWKSCFRRRAPP